MLPGGGPQGTRLGLFLFLILINAAGYEHLEKNIGQHINLKLTKRIPIHEIHMKFVDDMTLAEAFNLKDCVIPNPNTNPVRPLNYHDRTEHVLPSDSNVMQMQLDKIVRYCEDNEMRINIDKTKVALFNSARNYDCMPNLQIGNHTLEVVEEFKLLGLIFKSNLTWQANTDNMCKKAYARLWMLRRLKALGGSKEDILDVFNKQIRSVLELAVAVWQPRLSQAECKQIERVQKCAFYTIMGEDFVNYNHAVEYLNSETLSDRRLKLCLNFAKRAEKHPKYHNWFSEEDEYIRPVPNTRSDKNAIKTKYKVVPTRTDRFKNSPIPYLTDMINEHYMKK